MGKFQFMRISWNAGGTIINGLIKYYTGSSSLLFSHTWPTSVANASVGDKDSVVSSFPSMQIGALTGDKLGFLSYGKRMMGYDGLSIGRWVYHRI